MNTLYDAVFYNGWIEPPGYFLIDTVEGTTPEQALLENLAGLTEQVRRMFFEDDQDPSDNRLQETIYVLRANALVSTHSIESARFARRLRRIEKKG